jgi:hypothetical protein
MGFTMLIEHLLCIPVICCYQSDAPLTLCLGNHLANSTVDRFDRLNGEIRGEPTDLANNDYTHHADAFGYCIEGALGGADYALPNTEARGAPRLAGLRNRTF